MYAQNFLFELIGNCRYDILIDCPKKISVFNVFDQSSTLLIHIPESSVTAPILSELLVTILNSLSPSSLACKLLLGFRAIPLSHWPSEKCRLDLRNQWSQIVDTSRHNCINAKLLCPKLKLYSPYLVLYICNERVSWVRADDPTTSFRLILLLTPIDNVGEHAIGFLYLWLLQDHNQAAYLHIWDCGSWAHDQAKKWVHLR